MRTVRSSSRLLGGVSAPGGCLVPGGVCLVWGEGCLLSGGCLVQEVCVVSQHALRQTLPCGQTHTCKNITFATSLRTVIIHSMHLYLHATSFRLCNRRNKCTLIKRVFPNIIIPTISHPDQQQTFIYCVKV